MKALIFYFLILLIVGCSGLISSKKGSTSFDQSIAGTVFSKQDFQKRQDFRETDLASVRGKLQLNYHVARGSLFGQAQFLKDKNRSRLEVSDPMGRVRYWLIGDTAGILAFYEPEKTAYSSGGEGRSYFRKFFGLNLSWQELEGLWMGILPKTWRNQLSDEWNQREGFYEGTIKTKRENIAVRISEKSGELVQVQWRSLGKDIEMVFSDFDACCSRGGAQTLLGHGVTIKLPARSDKIELEWNELNILTEEPNPLGFSRRLSAGIKQVDLGD